MGIDSCMANVCNIGSWDLTNAGNQSEGQQSHFSDRKLKVKATVTCQNMFLASLVNAKYLKLLKGVLLKVRHKHSVGPEELTVHKCLGE